MGHGRRYLTPHLSAFPSREFRAFLNVIYLFAGIWMGSIFTITGVVL